MLPVMASLLGETGVLIFGILLLLRFIQTITVLFAGRLLLPAEGDLDSSTLPEMALFSGTALLKQSLRDTLPSIKHHTHNHAGNGAYFHSPRSRSFLRAF